MPDRIFLASKSLSALPVFLSGDTNDVRLLFVATAANVYDNPTWVEDDRQALTGMGIRLVEFDLDGVRMDDCVRALHEVNGVYIAGGNTFYLLAAIRSSGFSDALSQRPDLMFIGSSAGAVVAASDIAYVSPIDDASKAPNLESTRGLSLVDFKPLPHFDNKSWREKLDHIAATEGSVIPLRDDQAIIVRNGEVSLVESQ